MTRNELIGEAVDKCLKELYSYVQPKVTWKEFMKENSEYLKKLSEWNKYTDAKYYEKENPQLWEEWNTIRPNWRNKNITECIGPRPYEFYFLPQEIMKDICDSYVNAYRLDIKQEFLDNIDVLKNYCVNPIVDKYVNDWVDETGFHHPGYRSYDHPDNLEKEIDKVITNYKSGKMPDQELLVNNIKDKFFEFLDMAGNFYNWNRDLNQFNMSVYLGPSPNSNKEKVIENWKKFRDKDIEIDEGQINKDYYGDDE